MIPFNVRENLGERTEELHRRYSLLNFLNNSIRETPDLISEGERDKIEKRIEYVLENNIYEEILQDLKEEDSEIPDRIYIPGVDIRREGSKKVVYIP